MQKNVISLTKKTLLLTVVLVLGLGNMHSAKGVSTYAKGLAAVVGVGVGFWIIKKLLNGSKQTKSTLGSLKQKNKELNEGKSLFEDNLKNLKQKNKSKEETKSGNNNQSSLVIKSLGETKQPEDTHVLHYHMLIAIYNGDLAYVQEVLGKKETIDSLCADFKDQWKSPSMTNDEVKKKILTETLRRKLGVAVNGGDEAGVEEAIKNGVNLNDPTDSEGTTAIQIACKIGYFKMVEFLIKHHVTLDKNVVFLAYRGNWSETLKLLIFNGVDINEKNPFGKEGGTLLHEACKKNDFSTVEELVKNKTELKLELAPKDTDGKTPLDYAKQNNFQEIITLMKKAGAKA